MIRPAVIAPMNQRQSLDLARNLGRHGIPVIGLAPDPSTPARGSRYVRIRRGPDATVDSEAYLADLMRLGEGLGQRAVLFPMGDQDVLAVSGARDRLAAHFDFVLADVETVRRLVSKATLAELASAAGVPGPATATPADEAAVAELAATLPFPVILKPGTSPSWRRPEVEAAFSAAGLSPRSKAIECRDGDELLDRYRLVAAFDRDVVVQEVIPGPDANLVYVPSYVSRDGATVATFAGRKVRIYPIGFGSASCARTIDEPRAEELARRLLTGVGFRGLAGVELKLDPRDGEYKLIEVNVRFGLWDGLGARVGVDLAHLAYRDAIGEPIEEPRPTRYDAVWLDVGRDLQAALDYRRRDGLGPVEYMRSLRGRRMVMTLAADDPRPAALEVTRLASRGLARAGRSVRRLLGGRGGDGGDPDGSR